MAGETSGWLRPPAVSRLLDAGHEVIFCTNHATSPQVKQKQLLFFGVPDAVVLTSAEVAAAACNPDDRVLALGEPSLVAVLADLGLDVTDVDDLPVNGPVGHFDTVVIGSTPHWDRSRVGLVADAIRAGARFLATNDDATFPFASPAGLRLLPGAGALIAAIATTAGVEPEVTGKPNLATVDLLLERYGPIDFVVGDSPDTDGELAVGLGAAFALVLSGVTKASDLPVEPEPKLVGDDLSRIVDQVLGP